ncbi:MAG: nucleotide exchange factor GrpE [Microbacteriaceae bacterium]|jgi:molecular chaperone GrpE|nr:nucleotide exchange factor GrpE [Microbacteriaceae bacterium]
MSDNEQNNDEHVPPTEPVEDSTEDTTDEAGEPSLADEAAEQNAEELLESMLGEVERNLVEEYRDRAARAEAELANFRTRVERDRAANRDAVIAEVIRAVLPAMDDLNRAESHGDLAGSPLEIVAQKIRTGFGRFGLASVGEVGEAFDPNRHEAIVKLPTEGATSETVADVVEVGYTLGDRLIRPAKVAVAAPTE